MKPPGWLAEFYREWSKVRGNRIQPASRSYFYTWEDLLDLAGLRSSFERDHALKEAEDYEKQGLVSLKRYNHRIVQSISLPVAKESWLISLFGDIPARELHQQSIAIVRAQQAKHHTRWPESWNALCTSIIAAFTSEKNLPPFAWKDPQALQWLFETLHALTSREWPAPTLIRDASIALGLDSKKLEHSQASLESALSRLFAELTNLESLGISTSQSHALVHGSLRLHFDDGTIQEFDALQGAFTISLTDLQRAAFATSKASRILSIENSKTSFRQAAAANKKADSLLLATSYPNRATARLLQLLPAELPHYHFGDTDPSGYAILRSLRKLDIRPVGKFLMDWQADENSPKLSEHDLRLIPSLLAEPLLIDCQPSLTRIAQAGKKGRFEQENHGPATLSEWPFWLGSLSE